MKILLTNFTKLRVSDRFFKKILKNIYKIIPDKEIELISLNLVGIHRMSMINREYRSKDGSTDTISFAFIESGQFPGENMLGEIFICPQVIKLNARKNQVSFKNELSRVFIHSVLHLLGFTHESKGKRAKMDELTKKILDI